MQARPHRIQFSGSGLRRLPVVWEQFGEPGNRMVSDARQDILEPCIGIDSQALTGCHKTPQHRAGAAALIASEEEPVVAAHRYAANAALGVVVVDLQIAVLAVAV